MPALNDDVIDGIHRRLWAEASERFGSKFKVPDDVVWSISEYVRGLSVLQTFRRNGGVGSVVSFLRSYGISDGCVESLVRDGYVKGEVKQDGPVGSRKARLRAFEDWAVKHRGEQFSTDQLIEVSGFSRASLLDYLRISRLFVKVKRGVFEVANR